MVTPALSLLAAGALAAAAFFWLRARRTARRAERLRACVEAGGWACYEIGGNGAMRWSGNAAEVLAAGEHPLPDSVGQWMLRIDPAQRDDMDRRYRELLAGRPAPAREFTVRHGEGAEVICEDIAQPFRAAGPGAWEVVGLVRNATRQKALQEEIRQARPIVSVGRIAGMIAHDLANVLSTIHGQSRLLAASSGLEGAGRLTAAIMAAAERGRQLCQQILFVARPRAVRDDLRAGDLVQELRTMLAGLAQPGVSIETSVEGAGVPVRGNSGRLLQALLNLCINAMEAMKAGGGVLTLRCSLASAEAPLPSALGIVPVGRYVCFEVADTGEGIPQHLLSRIFEPGYSTKEGDAPRGLGLAIIAAVLTEVGAFLVVDSKAGSGTSFKVYFPSPGAAQPDNVLRSAKLGAGESVLLLDFDEESLLRMEDMVADIGYEPNAFSDCDEAMRSLRAHDGAHDAYQAALVASNATLADGTPFYGALARYLPVSRVILVCRSSQSVPAAGNPVLLEPYTHADLGMVLSKVVNR